MKTIVLIVAVILYAQALTDEELHEKWLNFKAKHSKLYRSALEERKRFTIFKKNVEEIEEHNKRYNAGQETFWMGINQFTDMTEQEFLDFVGPSRHYSEIEPEITDLHEPKLEAPTEINWLEKEALNPPKNQENCGCCYSFATTGVLESRNKIKTGKLISLSEQNLVDCSQKYGNNGCKGGLMTNSYEYVKENGITTEEKYPYKAEVGECKYDKNDNALNITSYTRIRRFDESHLKSAVAEGPVAVGFDATKKLMSYEGGILYDFGCSRIKLNHALLVVGYGGEGSKNHWILRNSWGEDWGDKGNFKLARGFNMCGVATMASYPQI